MAKTDKAESTVSVVAKQRIEYDGNTYEVGGDPFPIRASCVDQLGAVGAIDVVPPAAADSTKTGDGS